MGFIFKFARIKFSIVIHCLIPLRYYHRVKSTDRNFAVSFLFGTNSEFAMSGCDVTTTSLPLEDAHVQWRYPGHGFMSMGNSAPDEMREMFFEYLTDMLDGEGAKEFPSQVFIEDLVADLAAEMPYIAEHLGNLLSAKQVLGNVDSVSFAHLESLPYDVWRDIAAAFSYDPSNDPDAELFYISKPNLVNVLKDATYYDAVSKDTFIAVYRTLNGSTRIARQLFGQLSSDGGQTVTWYDVTQKDHVFDGFGRDHDRGDSDMSERNDEVKRRAEDEMRANLRVEKSEL